MIKKLSKITNIFLYNPNETISAEKINNFIKSDKKYLFDYSDVDFTKHSQKLFEEVKKIGTKFILISHSRGYMYANVFGNLYYKHILGYVNIDGGKSDEEFKLYLKNNKEKYQNIKNDDLLLYFDELKKSTNIKEISKLLSNYVNYNQFKQYKKLK